MQTNLIKSSSELKQAMFVVMVPDEVDAHGDITTAQEISKACHNFNLFCRQPNLFHISKTNTFDFIESYILPMDFPINDTVIKAGSWVANLQIHDNELWELIKSGEVNGLSIGALAYGDPIDEE
jgi:hypothetical protein